MKYFVLLFITMTATGLARDLTLEQALRLAEGHSARLKVSQATYEASAKMVGAAKTERYPTLALDARASYIDDIPSLDLAIPGLIDLSRDIGSKDVYQTDLRLTLPLYTGGRIGSGIKSAHSSETRARATLEATRNQVQFQTRLDFFGLYRTDQLRKAAAAALQRTEILRDDIQAGYNAGVADSVDLLEVRLAWTQAEFKLRQAEIALRTGQIQFLNRLGWPIDETLELVDSLPDPVSPTALTTNGRRPELEAANAVVSQAEAGLNYQQSGWLPTLTAYSGYSYGKPNNDIFTGGWNDFFTVGAQFNWSLNLGLGTSRKTEAARFEIEAARQRFRDLNESIDRETDIAAENLKLAYLQYTSARDQYEITRDSYRLARNQFQSGTLSSNRLLEIEASLTLAEATAAAAKVGFYLSQSAYFYTAGDENLGKGI